MSKKMSKKKKKQPVEGTVSDVSRLASASEQTGLIPAALTEGSEAEAYEALWPLVAQKTTEE